MRGSTPSLRHTALFLMYLIELAELEGVLLLAWVLEGEICLVDAADRPLDPADRLLDPVDRPLDPADSAL